MPQPANEPTLGHRVADLIGPTAVFDAVRSARRPGTFLFRWLYIIGLGGIALFWLYVFFVVEVERTQRSSRLISLASTAEFAERFFYLCAGFQFAIVCLLTPAYTAGAITDEKERKTLDYLLATQMSPREIILGKLGMRVWLLFLFVLGGLPVIASMQFFGGIDPNLLLLVIGLTLLTVVSIATTSLFCSVIARRSREAFILSYAIGFGYLIGSQIVYEDSHVGIQRGLSPDLQRVYEIAAEVIAAGNPFVLVQRAWGGSNSGMVGRAADEGLRYAIFHAVVSVVLFALAAMMLRPAARAAHAPPRFGLLRFITGQRLRARHHPAVGDDPMFWKEVYVETGQGARTLGRAVNLIIVLVVVYGLGVVVWELATAAGGTTLERIQDGIQGWVRGVTLALGHILFLLAAIQGAGAITREKEHDTSTGLMTTPLTAWEILRAKFWGCMLARRTLLYTLASVWLVGALTGSVAVLGTIAFALVFPLFMMGYSWIGLWCSAHLRTTLGSTFTAVTLAALASGVGACLGCCMCAGVGGMAMAAVRELPEFFAYLVGSYFVCLIPGVVLFGISESPGDVESFFQMGKFFEHAPAMIMGATGAIATWAGMGYVLSQTTWNTFRRMMNRKE